MLQGWSFEGWLLTPPLLYPPNVCTDVDVLLGSVWIDLSGCLDLVCVTFLSFQGHFSSKSLTTTISTLPNKHIWVTQVRDHCFIITGHHCTGGMFISTRVNQVVQYILTMQKQTPQIVVRWVPSKEKKIWGFSVMDTTSLHLLLTSG